MRRAGNSAFEDISKSRDPLGYIAILEPRILQLTFSVVDQPDCVLNINRLLFLLLRSDRQLQGKSSQGSLNRGGAGFLQPLLPSFARRLHQIATDELTRKNT